eukprot:scaffold32720_cov18-Phaeocystis_antarctica.AAC.1
MDSGDIFGLTCVRGVLPSAHGQPEREREMVRYVSIQRVCADAVNTTQEYQNRCAAEVAALAFI